MTNIMKLQAPFECLRSCCIDPDVALRKAIVLQAIIDVTTFAQNAKAKVAKLEARGWIFGNSEYFQRICFEGDLDPHLIINITKELLRMTEAECKSGKMINLSCACDLEGYNRLKRKT